MGPASTESEELVAISALQHLLFCERQAALIHVDRMWLEDVATAEGRVLHERADLPGATARDGVRVARAVELRSHRLALVGRADVVEYRASSVPGGWQPFPVEYKRGAVKHALADRVQLCAQALCLEEMHGCEVPAGAIFYGTSHRRLEVAFDPSLRLQVESAAKRMHALLRKGVVPRVALAPKCRACSLRPVCLPEATGPAERSAEILAAILEEDD